MSAYFSVCLRRSLVTRDLEWGECLCGWPLITSHSGECLCGWPSDTAYRNNVWRHINILYFPHWPYSKILATALILYLVFYEYIFVCVACTSTYHKSESNNVLLTPVYMYVRTYVQLFNFLENTNYISQNTIIYL